MKNLTDLQKAILKNVLNNFKKGLHTWVVKEELSFPDKIAFFFEEKSNNGFFVEFDMFIDHLVSDVNENSINPHDFQNISFMLENQSWMPTTFSDEVIEMAQFPFPKYIDKHLML